MSGHKTLLYPNDNKKTEIFTYQSHYHNDNDQPAIIDYYEDGEIRRERWYRLGKFHRGGDHPVQIDYFSDGKVMGKVWAVNGINGRESKEPSTIQYYPNGKKQLEVWFIEGQMKKTKFYPIE